jgi:hypothetical protein
MEIKAAELAGGGTPESQFTAMDNDSDGKVTLDEFKVKHPDGDSEYEAMDISSDKFVLLTEYTLG